MPSLVNSDSLIFEVHFAGLCSDTLTMQRNGWQISQQLDPMGDSLQLAFKHEACRLYMLSGYIDRRAIYEATMRGRRLECPIPVQIQYAFSQAEMRIPVRSDVSWLPIDATPTGEFLSMPQEQWIPFDKWVPFRGLDPEAPEIIVPEHTIPELMELILSKQDLKQKEIRDKQRKARWREEYREKESISEFGGVGDMKAQIIAFG